MITLYVQHTFFPKQQKKTTLNGFVVHFFAVVLHDYNVASRNFLVTRFMEEMLDVFLFTFLFPFTLGAASISHFLTAAIKFSCYSYDEIGLLCFLSLASSFSVIHVSLDIEIKSKERIGFVVVIFPLKVRVAMLFTAETRGYLKCKISIRLT